MLSIILVDDVAIHIDVDVRRSGILLEVFQFGADDLAELIGIAFVLPVEFFADDFTDPFAIPSIFLEGILDVFGSGGKQSMEAKAEHGDE